MKIGYLHVGIRQDRESGVTRSGRRIAKEAKTRAGLTVLEANVTLTQDKRGNANLLREAAQELSEAEIVHIQYTKYTWGRSWTQLYYLWSFIHQLSCPIVVTIHDIYPDIYPTYGFLTALGREYEKQLRYQVGWPKLMARTIFQTLAGYFADALAVRLLSRWSQIIIVSTEEEMRRLAHLVDPNKVKIIPLFVEERAPTITSSEARQKLELEDFKVVTLQGFIYVNKGHQLLVEALSKLPQEVKVIFAGGPAGGNEMFLEKLLKLAEKNGVRDRLHVTGFLTEEDLESYLLATDLAICPFKILSASASLSTWISVARPILASDLPQISEYNRREPGAIHTFAPYTADALAEAIKELLPTCQASEDAAVARLREKLSMTNIFNEHLKFYQTLIDSHSKKHKND